MTSSERLVAKSLKLPVHPIVSRRSRRARASLLAAPTTTRLIQPSLETPSANTPRARARARVPTDRAPDRSPRVESRRLRVLARVLLARVRARASAALASTRAAMRPREVPPDGQFRARERADREDRQRRRLHAAIGARASASRAARAPTTASSDRDVPSYGQDSPTIATGADRGRRARAPETRAPIADASRLARGARRSRRRDDGSATRGRGRARRDATTTRFPAHSIVVGRANSWDRRGARAIGEGKRDARATERRARARR